MFRGFVGDGIGGGEEGIAASDGKSDGEQGKMKWGAWEWRFELCVNEDEIHVSFVSVKTKGERHGEIVDWGDDRWSPERDNVAGKR